MYHGNDRNYYTIPKSQLESISLLAEVTLGKESGVWNQTPIVSLGGGGQLSAHQRFSPRKIRKMPIWGEIGLESMLHPANKK